MVPRDVCRLKLVVFDFSSENWAPWVLFRKVNFSCFFPILEQSLAAQVKNASFSQLIVCPLQSFQKKGSTPVMVFIVDCVKCDIYFLYGGPRRTPLQKIKNSGV
jgi:hypothetical protein